MSSEATVQLAAIVLLRAARCESRKRDSGDEHGQRWWESAIVAHVATAARLLGKPSSELREYVTQLTDDARVQGKGNGGALVVLRQLEEAQLEQLGAPRPRR